MDIDVAPRAWDEQSTGNESFELIEGNAKRGLVLLCDHATNAMPSEYGWLGLSEADLERHIAYDIGTAALTRALASRLDAPALMTRFSRLLIDPNRGEDDPTLIMRVSDGAVVPGNRHVDGDERNRRIARFHAPYHQAIDEMIDMSLETGREPVVLSIHSFTPLWRGWARPWHAGILWDQDPRIALPLIEGLRREPALVVGDNEPYSGSLKNDTMYRHGTMRGLPHALVEIRHDLIRSDDGVAEWAERLSGIVGSLLQEPVSSAAHAFERAASGRTVV